MFIGSIQVGAKEMTQTDLWQSVAIGLLSVALISYGVILYRFMDIVRDIFKGFVRK